MLFLAEKGPCGVPPQQNKNFKYNIPINVARAVQKVAIIEFIRPKIARKPENRFFNRINLLIRVSGYDVDFHIAKFQFCCQIAIGRPGLSMSPEA